MIYITTILIYVTLFSCMYFLCKTAQKRNNWTYVVIAITIYAIIFGMRYGVGHDFFGYLEYYKDMSHSIFSMYKFEKGFTLLTEVTTGLQLHYSCFFGIIAFIQLYFICLSVKKERYIYQWLIFALSLSCAWMTFNNGLRQVLAFSIFIYSISIINNKKDLIFSIILIYIATTFHNSAIALFIIPPILFYRNEWFRNTRNQIVLLVAAIIIGEIDIIASNLHFFEEILSANDFYADYAERSSEQHQEVTKGIGFFIILITDILLIVNSKKAKEYVNSVFFTRIYNLYFVGTLVRYALMQSHAIQRFNMYFYSFNFIIGAYTLYYLYSTKKWFVFYLLISMYALTFIATMMNMNDNTAAYHFFWESTK